MFYLDNDYCKGTGYWYRLYIAAQISFWVSYGEGMNALLCKSAFAI
jgi:hypothetical protein